MNWLKKRKAKSPEMNRSGAENYIHEDYLTPSAQNILLDDFSLLKKRFSRLAVVLLIITALSGVQTIYFNKLIKKEVVSSNALSGKISTEIKNLQKRGEDIAALHSLEPSISIQTQWTVLMAALGKTGYIVKNLEYNSAASRYSVVKDGFLVQTGRNLDTVDKSGLWSVEVFSQDPDIMQASQRFASLGSSILSQVNPEDKIFVVSSGGAGSRGTSQTVLHVMFWRQQS